MLCINTRMGASRVVSVHRRRFFGIFAGMAVTILFTPLALAGAFEDYFSAVKSDNVNVVRSLLQRGFDPNTIEAERGDTGLILALREGSMKVFDLLMRSAGTDIEAKIRNGDTALMIAAYQSNQPAVEALLAKGAEVNRPGWTALHYAAAAGSNAIVQLLLDKSAYIDAESPNKTTPIMMAAYRGHILTVKLLLDEGADATLKNELGMTAIDLAARFGHADIAEGLTYRLKRAGKL
jgi:ankyrin repeat protein